MAKFDVRILSLLSTSDDAEKPSFSATGTIDGEAFNTRTILWGPKDNKEPIFKIVEGEELAQSLAASSVSRGQRIAIARMCKLVRLGEVDLFDPTAEANTSKDPAEVTLAKKGEVSQES